ncbi:hypothetical protein XBKQ1_1990021 [Xenorhabdus bovienii str. kraussei Quebec]|uniref:Uncharacterized protein n=3 Tax=Xenorhabdus bovienii TaxID=40576 RepID=A0A077PEZ3_XENBV|nr:hypothetical protein XBFFR1_2420010 [Xenorhabdus bovienii str. feltiae France]CDG94877.1 hypothetical protein XBFFL1_920010 [Xenorhabdus bovienii str. feltiae Florida]CDH19256.1 hypothetical protein XBKQ1_1990021 [Xenorhabdus bovienii str. kraussei Quebec]CDH24712.1 hypothetical protein XBKB1_3000040 [Xenorhabdus bovienii str. kraussei Becker Underwood]CDH32978.1 hypothetical protein XBI1_2290032 [Xenorhabdus bovienii str. Intermedium]
MIHTIRLLSLLLIAFNVRGMLVGERQS